MQNSIEKSNIFDPEAVLLLISQRFLFCFLRLLPAAGMRPACCSAAACWVSLRTNRSSCCRLEPQQQLCCNAPSLHGEFGNPKLPGSLRLHEEPATASSSRSLVFSFWCLSGHRCTAPLKGHFLQKVRCECSLLCINVQLHVCCLIFPLRMWSPQVSCSVFSVKVCQCLMGLKLNLH